MRVNDLKATDLPYPPFPADPEDMPLEDFQVIALADVFKHAEPDGVHAQWLRTEALERLDRYLKTTAADLNLQISNHNSGEFQRDESWRRKVVGMKKAVDARLVEVVPLVKQQRRLAFSPTLRDAITTHRIETEEAGLEPTEADIELWASLRVCEADAT